MDIVYVILNYKNCDVTFDCVESIQQYNTDNTHKIIIVDNGATDLTKTELNERYNKCEDIIIISNEENLGFAKGNNIGIFYAREKWDPDYICVLNSDVKLLNNILDELQDISSKIDCAVIGPMILSEDLRYDSNPMADHLYTQEEISKEIRHTKRIISLNKLHLLNFYYFYQRIKHSKTIRYRNKMDYTNLHLDCKLHGACYFFTRKFFEIFSGFNDETFLYFEEDILFLELTKAGLHSVYDPQIQIYHAEDASTLAKGKMDREKIDFIYRNRLDSQLIYQRMLIESGVAPS